MHFAYTTLLCIVAQLAFGNAAALPLAGDDSEQLQARAGGGIGDILKDHVKYTTNPPTALEPIPAEDSNALRETHRQAHKTILDVMTGGGAGKAGNKAGNDAAEKGGDKADKAGKADKGDKGDKGDKA